MSTPDSNLVLSPLMKIRSKEEGSLLYKSNSASRKVKCYKRESSFSTKEQNKVKSYTKKCWQKTKENYFVTLSLDENYKANINFTNNYF